jgi:hypothetical protein
MNETGEAESNMDGEPASSFADSSKDYFLSDDTVN